MILNIFSRAALAGGALIIAPAAARAETPTPPAVTVLAALPPPLPQATTPTGAQLPIQTLQATVQKPSAVAPRSPYPAEALGWGPRQGVNFYQSRWAEDWSALRDPSAKLAGATPAKFLPFDRDGAVYLTLSGAFRYRLNVNSAPGLRAGRDRQLHLTRTMLGADLHLGEHLRVFGEVASGQAFGRNIGKASGTNENDLSVQQAFVELSGTVAGATAGVMAGRQEFIDGPRLLIAVRDIPNIHISYNGVRAYADWAAARVTVFDFTVTGTGLGAFDESWDNGQRLRGLNASVVLARGEMFGEKTKLFLDPFLFDMRDDDRAIGRARGVEDRTSFGARAWGEIGAASFDWVVIGQSGSFLGREIDAYAFSATTSLQVEKNARGTRIGLRADIGSGGGSFAQRGTIRAFSPLFYATNIQSDDNFVGPINMYDVAPTVSLSLSPTVKLASEFSVVRRLDETDAVYTGQQAAYAGTQAVRGHDAMRVARLNLTWTPNPFFSVIGLYNHVDAGTVLRRAGYGDNDYFGTIVNLRF